MEAFIEEYQKFLTHSSGVQNMTLLDEFEDAIADVLRTLDTLGRATLLDQNKADTLPILDLGRIKAALQKLRFEGLSLNFKSDADMVRFTIKLAYTRALKRAR